MPVCTTKGRAEYVSANLLSWKELSARWSPRTPSTSASSAPRMSKSDLMIVNISGGGDKDICILRENLAL
jgi:hypothetical protein